MTGSVEWVFLHFCICHAFLCHQPPAPTHCGKFSAEYGFFVFIDVLCNFQKIKPNIYASNPWHQLHNGGKTLLMGWDSVHFLIIHAIFWKKIYSTLTLQWIQSKEGFVKAYMKAPGAFQNLLTEKSMEVLQDPYQRSPFGLYKVPTGKLIQFIFCLFMNVHWVWLSTVHSITLTYIHWGHAYSVACTHWEDTYHWSTDWVIICMLNI